MMLLHNDMIPLIPPLAYASHISCHSSAIIIKVNRLTTHVISMRNGSHNTANKTNESNNDNDEDDYNNNTYQTHFRLPLDFFRRY